MINGLDRQIGDEDNGWFGEIGDWVEFSFDYSEQINELSFVFDSNLNRSIHNMPCNYPLEQNDFHVPESMIKEFKILILNNSNKWEEHRTITNNYQRQVKIKVDLKTRAIRFVPIATWGSERFHVFSWDIS